MTLGQNWDRQMLFPGDLCPFEKTKTESHVPYHTSVLRSQLGVGATRCM